MRRAALFVAAALACVGAAAQPAPRPDNAVVLLTASAELELANDEAIATFAIEAQDADAQRAQAQVNLRMAEGTAALKKADPGAQLETGGYASYPLYARDGAGNRITGWRVRQTVQLRTSDLAKLPQTVAQGQQAMTLAGIDFRVSRKSQQAVQAELIRRAVDELNARAAVVAQALKVAPERMRLEELAFGPESGHRPPVLFQARASAAAEAVPSPALEAGSSVQQLSVSAKLRVAAP